MSILNLTGAESGHTYEVANSGGAGFTASTTVAHSGTYSYKIVSSTTGSTYFILSSLHGSGSNQSINAPSVYTSFYFYVDRAPGADEMIAYGLSTAAGRVFELRYKASNGALILLKAGGAVLGTSTTTLVARRWYCISLYVEKGVSSWSLWIDNNLEISGLGNGGVNNIDSIAYGVYINRSLSTCTFYYDDIIHDSTQTHFGYEIQSVLLPDGPGSNSGWSNDETYVDDPAGSISDADYIYSTLAARTESYSFSNLAGTYSIVACKGFWRGAFLNAHGGSPSDIRLLLKSGATNQYSVTNQMNTTWGTLQLIYQTDPNTSAAWAQAAVNAIELGINHNYDIEGNEARCSVMHLQAMTMPGVAATRPRYCPHAGI